MALEVDREALAGVVTETFNLCEETIRGTWLPRDLVGLYEAALPDVERTMREGLGVLRGDDPEIAESLERAGLTGTQRELKVESFWRSVRRFRERATKAFLRPVFKKANTILGSLTSIIVNFEPLKELKELLEVDINDSDAGET